MFSADQKIAARNGQHYVYADASVVCGPLELGLSSKDVLGNPSVIVEVLSKGTEAYDRGLKWESYRDLPSVTDYVLVSQPRHASSTTGVKPTVNGITGLCPQGAQCCSRTRSA